jgi:RecA-family ATPase
MPKTEWLIESYVPTNCLMLIYGEPGSFKSFLALDWALSIAAGKEWLGAATKAARSLYVMGEGIRGLRMRTNAWQLARGNVGDDIKFVSNAVAIIDSGPDIKYVKKQLREYKPAFLVVDTVARCFGMGDENSTKDMSAFVAACDDLRATVSDMTLCLLHHTGWSEETAHRPRGSIALHAANDLEYMCKRFRLPGDKSDLGRGLRLTMPRTKEGDARWPEQFELINSGESLVLQRDTSEEQLAATLESEGSYRKAAKIAGMSKSTLHRRAGGRAGKLRGTELPDYQRT